MLLNRYRAHINIFSVIIIFINIIYIIHCIQQGFVTLHESTYQFICDIILPRRFINIVDIFSIAYLFGEKSVYHTMNVLAMKDRNSIWKLRFSTSIEVAFLDTLLFLMVFVSVNMPHFKSLDEWRYTFLTGILIYLQLCAGFILIELTKWIFNSQRLGFIMIVTIGIWDAYTPLIPLFYRRFSIMKDLTYTNMNMILFKIVCCFIINCVLIFAGYIYSNKKEFIY